MNHTKSFAAHVNWFSLILLQSGARSNHERKNPVKRFAWNYNQGSLHRVRGVLRQSASGFM
eukprot:5355181-Amphidinium_carterae.1